MGILLYVDDIRSCPPGWELARTITEAIRVLATVPVDVVSLDHDISYKVEAKLDSESETTTLHVDSPETFEPVARYLALIPADRRPRVEYHTSNPSGEERMRAILSDAENQS